MTQQVMNMKDTQPFSDAIHIDNSFRIKEAVTLLPSVAPSRKIVLPCGY